MGYLGHMTTWGINEVTNGAYEDAGKHHEPLMELMKMQASITNH